MKNKNKVQLLYAWFMLTMSFVSVILISYYWFTTKNIMDMEELIALSLVFLLGVGCFVGIMNIREEL